MRIIPDYCPRCHKPTTRDDYPDAPRQKHLLPENRLKMAVCRQCVTDKKRPYNKDHRDHINEVRRVYKSRPEVKEKNNLPEVKEKNREKNRERSRGEKFRLQKRNSNLKRSYGLSLQQYNAMYESQQGLCAICGKPEMAMDCRTGRIWNLGVDHNHDTNKVRGLLCKACNIDLARHEKKIWHLKKYIDYLVQYDNL